MKISAVYLNYNSLNNRNKNNLCTSNIEIKQNIKSANDIIANYNVAFSGLFSKNIEPKYDATKLTFNHRMEPNVPYLIAEDSRFSLNGYRINLNNEYEKSLIQRIKPGESLVFGREAISLPGMHSGVSRKHLKIEKTKDDKLIATDLGSLNGTIIEQNIQTPNPQDGSFKLFPQQRYLLPTTSVFNIDGYTLNLLEFSSEISSMQDGDYKNYTVFNEVPLQIEKFGENIIARNLSNVVKTTFLYLDETQYQNDFSQIYAPAMLQSNVPTLIPKNSQLGLGAELTIDTRDKKINDLLDKKRRIVIGRNFDCDYVVNQFYNQVSGKHLTLERTSSGLVATDLSSTNATYVIPQSHMRAIYKDVNGLSLKQGNIGDCTLLSSLYSLSLTQRGKELINNMVSIDEDGGYTVQFPDYKPIKVGLDELYGQENKKGEKKYSVESDLGIKAIERAYAKYLNRFGSYGPTMFGEIDKGALLRTPLYNLTKISPKTVKVKQTNLDYFFYEIMQTGGFNKHAITCSTPTRGKYEGYVDYPKRFIENHAYSIKNVDFNSRTVDIVNPHNTKFYYSLGFEEFSEYFYEICDLKL